MTITNAMRDHGPFAVAPEIAARHEALIAKVIHAAHGLTEAVPPPRSETPEHHRRAILAMLADNGWMGSFEVAAALSVSVNHAQSMLAELRKLGILRVQGVPNGKGRRLYWSLEADDLDPIPVDPIDTKPAARELYAALTDQWETLERIAARMDKSVSTIKKSMRFLRQIDAVQHRRRRHGNVYAIEWRR